MAIPSPEPGLVISYAYLWLTEREAGLEEGRKDRPSVVILKVQVATDVTRVVVLPITHSRPSKPGQAIEIPAMVARSVGLDEQPSWIVISEANEFAWPGHDLRKARTAGSTTVFFRLASSGKSLRVFWRCARAGEPS